jgi:RNA-directed DNA polymerase
MAKETRNRRAEKPDPIPEGSGRHPRGTGVGASNATAVNEADCRAKTELVEAVVERGNMVRAYRRVVRNKGSAGIDGMTVEELQPFLVLHWERIKRELLEGRYMPLPVLAVEIPKPDGGVRKLGIPTVLDRLVGQAIHQVLEPLFDPKFSGSSYGFRQNRNAHQAVLAARKHVSEGRRWVVDIDLEKFFDRVNHDRLMARLAWAVKDKRLLALIRRYLRAGILSEGVLDTREEGTPQGSPLSPLLSNIVLDVFDKELEKRGHTFCRYADDCNIYVRSRRAGERVMQSLTNFLKRKMSLTVNAAKSAVGRPWERKFLGYTMTWDKRPRLRIAVRSMERLKDNLRDIFRKGRGQSIPRIIASLNLVLRGWLQYFKLAEVRDVFELLDQWIRRKLRCVLWRQWKRVFTRAKNLMARGLDEVRAWRSALNCRGPWRNAGASHMNEAFKKSDFDRWGLVSLLDSILECRNLLQTAVYGTVRTVV